MRRLLILSATAVSLILAIASAAMWTRSHFHRDVYPDVVDGPHLGVQSIYHSFCLYSITPFKSWPRFHGRDDVDDPYRDGVDIAPYPSGFQIGFDISGHDLPITWQLGGPHLVYCKHYGLSPMTWKNGFGFQFISENVPFSAIGGAHVIGIVIPYWSLVVLFLGLPVVSTRKMRQALLRRKRRRANCCIECGYDLRASTGRCPECGTTISAAMPLG